MLPSLTGGSPLLREHRLYQVDWLWRFYGFAAMEARQVIWNQQNPAVYLLFKLACRTGCEAGHYLEFECFQELTKGELFSEIQSENYDV